MYNERPKKRHSFFLEKTAFLSGISLHFRPLGLRYCFSVQQNLEFGNRNRKKDSVFQPRADLFETENNENEKGFLPPSLGLRYESVNLPEE